MSIQGMLRFIVRRLANLAALLGVLAVVGVAWLVFVPEARQKAEVALLEWLTRRAISETAMELDPAGKDRATARELSTLPPAQAAIAQSLAGTYRVAPEPVAALVHEAYMIGPPLGLAPNLILAVAAVESNFHPYIQSQAGAQGLMQIMTRVHNQRLKDEGGTLAVFDPVVNLRVGAKILRDCVRLMGGSTEAGLRFYLGGGNTSTDAGDGYVQKVLGIQRGLDEIGAAKGLKR